MNSIISFDRPGLIFVPIVVVMMLAGCSKEDSTEVTLPVVKTLEVTSITSTTAVSGGSITSDGGGDITSRGICWSITPDPTIANDKSNDGSVGAGSYYNNLYGLSGNTTYYVRAYAVNSAGTGYGDAKTFTTSEQSFNTITEAATNIDTASAILNGTVNAQQLTVTVYFEYGPTSGYGTIVPADQNPVTGNENVQVSVYVSGLSIGTTYHYRVRTMNSLGGTEFGSDEIFVTLGQSPIATALEATNVKSVSASLNGSVNANHLYTVVSFEYGTTTGYGQSVNADPLTVTGSTEVSVAADIDGLSVFETYHYRVRAENQYGVTYSNDMTFTTHYVVGENYFGGVIFYLDDTGEHGLVCAPVDQSTGIIWYNGSYVLTNASATSVGTGAANTAAIVAIQGTGEYAAQLCNDLDLNGYSDWFLPSKDELNLMYDYLTHGEYGYAVYWSSSEGDLYNAWKLGVQTGGGDSNYYDKFGAYPVRAARAF